MLAEFSIRGCRGGMNRETPVLPGTSSEGSCVTGSMSAAVRRASTRAGVELMLAWGVVGIRAFDLTQAVVACLTGSLSKSTDPWLDSALLGLVTVESVLLGWWLIRRRSVRSTRWPVVLDIVIGLLSVAATVTYSTPVDRLNVWVMWSYPVTLSTVVFLGASLRRWQTVLLSSGVFVVVYAAVVAVPLADDPAGRATAVANTLAYPGFAMVAYLLSRFVRQLAATAEQATARVAELERDRSKAIVHDMLPYLRLDRFADADHGTRRAMIAQARAAYQQMRTFVDGTGDIRDVEATVRAVFELHCGLDIRAFIDLDRRIELPEDTIESLHRALDTALANVEQHAPNSAVVVTAQSRPDRVEITVHDDGPGFDDTQIRPGFGMAEILGRQLAAVEGTGEVTSAPGEGTTVRIILPRTLS
jgi:signal transduction histidine kinase